jgi:hypothetical protein
MGSQRISRRSNSPVNNDDEDSSASSSTNSAFSISVPLGHSDSPAKEVATDETQNGELIVTIASAILLFAHFGITLYRVDSNHPDSSIGKHHLKDRWALINVCIFVFALASHLYRQALSNLKIKFAPAVLVPDMCTTLVVLLILTKHVYFALYLLMAAVTFLSVMVTLFDVYAYVNPTKTVAGSKELYRTGEHKKDTESLGNSERSVLSSSSRSLRSSFTSAVNLRDMIANSISFPVTEASSPSVVYSGSSARKKAARSILRNSPKSDEKKKVTLWRS